MVYSISFRLLRRLKKRLFFFCHSINKALDWEMPNSHNKNLDGSLKMNYIYLILKIKNYFQFNAKQCF